MVDKFLLPPIELALFILLTLVGTAFMASAGRGRGKHFDTKRRRHECGPYQLIIIVGEVLFEHERGIAEHRSESIGYYHDTHRCRSSWKEGNDGHALPVELQPIAEEVYREGKRNDEREQEGSRKMLNFGAESAHFLSIIVRSSRRRQILEIAHPMV